MMPDSLASEIRAAAAAIRPYVRRTPVLEIDGRDLGLPIPSLTLKLELTQRSGSFKVRGAFANLLLRKVPPAGVVAASGGNHGAAVAFAANTLGIPAKIFVPRIATPVKIARIRACGAELVVGGEAYADALEASEKWASSVDVMRVHAYDQHETILGQGTMATELEEQAPALETVLVGVGGGGLISGVAGWYDGRLRVVGVEPENAPTLARALEHGAPIDVPVSGIAADSLGARRLGEEVFRVLQPRINRAILVTDEEIRNAQRRLWSAARIVAEPGGATALAAVLSGKYEPHPDERIGVIVSGGNTTAVDFDE